MEGRARKVVSRNRTTVSCTECHRRRKKCSQGQPCRNCARRYPPVECIYKNLKRTSPQSQSASLQNPAEGSWNEGSEDSSVFSSLIVISQATNEYPNYDLATPDDEFLTALHPSFHSGVSEEQRQKQRNLDFNASPGCTPNYSSSEKELSTCNGKIFENAFYGTVTDQQDQNTLVHLRPPILPPSLGTGTLDLLPKLSVDATPYNAELFYIYNQILLPRVWSIDGHDKCSQVFWDAWIPFTTFSPVILHANLLRASVWRESMRQASVLRIENHAPVIKDAPATLSLRLKAINLLNTRLRNGQVDDEGVAAVAFFFFNEWSFSDSCGLQGIEPHVRGLREMLRIRGGLHTLGSGGYIAKLVMLCHYHLATVLEREAFIVPSELLQDGFMPTYVTIDPSFDSPLFLSSGSFTEKSRHQSLLPITARMLDEMAYIISEIISHCYGQNPEFNWSSLFLTIVGVRDRIESLPPASTFKLPNTEDYIYECVRIVSLVYCRAIISKLPFSEACRKEDFERLFAAMSRVSLSRWKQLSGIWGWILLVMNPRARNLQEGIELRSLLKICAFAHAQREWQLQVNIMEGFMALQRWIIKAGRNTPPDPTTSAMSIENIKTLLQ